VHIAPPVLLSLLDKVLTAKPPTVRFLYRGFMKQRLTYSFSYYFV